MDIRTCYNYSSRTNPFNSDRPSGGKPECPHSLNKYFRQDSMFCLKGEDREQISSSAADWKSENSHQGLRSDDKNDILTPECVSNTKSSQTDFRSDETVLSQCVREYDPLYSDFNENQETKCRSNCSLGTNCGFTDAVAEVEKGELVNLDGYSLTSSSDGSPYGEDDLLEGLQSSEESIDEDDEMLVMDNVKQVSTDCGTSITFPRGCRQTRTLVYSLNDSSDEDDETFVRVPKNVLKDNQLTTFCTHQRSRKATSGVRRVSKWIWPDGFGQKKESSSPYSLVTKFSSPGQPISNILPNKDGSMWVTFQNSNVIKLYDYHGNAIDAIDVKMAVDDITRSTDGTLYISCPKSRRIKVLTKTLQLFTLVRTPTFVRGLAFSQSDSCLIACMVPNLANQPEQDCGCRSACVIRYFIRDHCMACARNADSYRSQPSRSKVVGRLGNNKSISSRCICLQDVYCVKGSKVTQENLFKYPFRVAVSSLGDIAVSDHGNRTVFLLSDAGSLLGRFDQSNLGLLANHALSYDVNNDLILVQSGRRNILRIRSHYDGSITVHKTTVTDLESQIVTAAAVDSEGILLVVTEHLRIKLEEMRMILNSLVNSYSLLFPYCVAVLVTDFPEQIPRRVVRSMKQSVQELYVTFQKKLLQSHSGGNGHIIVNHIRQNNMDVTTNYINIVILDDVSDQPPPPLPPRKPLAFPDTVSEEFHGQTKGNLSRQESVNLMTFSNDDEDTNDFTGNFEACTNNEFDSIISESSLSNLSDNETGEIHTETSAGMHTLTYNLDTYFTGNLFKQSSDLDSELKPKLYTPTFNTCDSDIDVIQPADGVDLPSLSGANLHNQNILEVIDSTSSSSYPKKAPSQASQKLREIEQEVNHLQQLHSDPSTTVDQSLLFVYHPKLSAQRSVSESDIYNDVEIGDNSLGQATTHEFDVNKGDLTGITRSKSTDNINQRTKTDRCSTIRHNQTSMKASSSFDCIKSTASKFWGKITKRSEDITERTPQKLSIDVVARVELSCPCERSCDRVQVLAAVQGGYMWVSFSQCPWVSLYNNQHERVYRFDTRGCVDSLTVSATGVLYVSCPPQKRILMLSTNLQMTVLRSFAKSYPRGIAVSPEDCTLVVCMVPKIVGSVMEGPSKDSFLMRFKGEKTNETGTMVNTGNHFGYPVKLTINMEGFLLVSDFGLRCLLVLDQEGNLLRTFSTIGGGPLWNVHALTSNTVSSFFVVQGGGGTLSITRIEENQGNFEEKSTSTKEEPLLIRKVSTSSMNSDGQIVLASGNILTQVSIV